MSIPLTIDYHIEGEDFTLDLNVTPGRPAPHASSPDSPNFSDPGSGDEIEIIKAVRESDNHELDSDELGKLDETLYDDNDFMDHVMERCHC